MRWSELVDSLTQRKAESQPGFVDEIAAHSRRGLTVIGCVELGLTAVAVVMKLLRLDYLHVGATVWWPNFVFVGLGIFALLSARLAPARLVRGIGVLVGVGSAVAMIASDIIVTHGQIGDKLVANVLTVMLVGLACLPLTPLMSILFNAFSVVAFATAWALAAAAGFPVPDNSGSVMLVVLAGLCVFLSCVSYQRMHEAWKGHESAIAALEEVRHSELRACNAESAVTNVRLAAALSHELNTPLGALKSAVQTITSAAGRMADASPERRERLSKAIEDAGGVATHATDRLSSVVQRIQRFSNLDGADHRDIDLKSMLEDIVALHEGSRETGRVELRLDEVAPFPGQPQALSSIFSTLLRKGLDAAGPEGRVTVRLGESGSWINVAIDHGQVDIPVDFQLGFAVEQDRVSSSNWDLFSARQVIRAHGGEIEAAGRTGIRVRLPLQAAPVAVAAR